MLSSALETHLGELAARRGEINVVALLNATKAMIGASGIAAMKSCAWLINIARGDDKLRDTHRSEL